MSCLRSRSHVLPAFAKTKPRVHATSAMSCSQLLVLGFHPTGCALKRLDSNASVFGSVLPTPRTVEPFVLSTPDFISEGTSRTGTWDHAP